MRSTAAGLVEARGSSSRFSETGAELLAELVQVLDQRARLDQRRAGRARARRRGSGSSRARRRRACPAPRSGGRGRARPRRGRRAAACPGRRSPRGPPSAARARARKSGSSSIPRRDVAAALGGGLAGLVGLDDEVGEALALARQRLERRWSEFAASRASSRFWLGEDLQHLVGLAQRRVGAVDDLVQLLAPARRAPVPSSFSRIAKRSR